MEEKIGIKNQLKELNQKKIPFMLCRTLPDKSEEYWRLEDLIIRPHY